jgi:N-acetylmuramic acid 6-phosphate etherase
MLDSLDTEFRNPKTTELDNLDVRDILRIMNEEDATIPLALRGVLDEISQTVTACVETVSHGGRIFYVGAGTSGRLAIIDAVETIPTFNAPVGLFVPVMAGGIEAAFKAVEGVEDDCERGEQELAAFDPKAPDIVIGVTASGRTPYVKGALRKARECGCFTALICNVKRPELSALSDITIKAVTGPEVLTGSTRLKAGTAQKMILNMISTATMVKSGKVYQNLMIDVVVLNEKLQERAIRIVTEITGESREVVRTELVKAGWRAKQAILQIIKKLQPEEAACVFQKHGGFLRNALQG